MGKSGNAAVNLDCNINVKVLDRHKRVVRDTSAHNKATVNLVDGILRYLKGDFSPTDYNKRVHAPLEGTPYLPTKVSFGFVGVHWSTEKPITPHGDPEGAPYFSHVDRSDFVQTVFTTSSLQEPCLDYQDSLEEGNPIVFLADKVRQVGYSDSNNAECLEFTFYISPGSLVGQVHRDEETGLKEFVPYKHSYYNPHPDVSEWEAMITEIGLVSDSGVLLARVLFDDEVKYDQLVDKVTKQDLGRYPVATDLESGFRPIVQSQSSTVVITWRIGIVSVGKGDKFVTANRS